MQFMVVGASRHVNLVPGGTTLVACLIVFAGMWLVDPAVGRGA
jgi:hypothetical protein